MDSLENPQMANKTLTREETKSQCEKHAKKEEALEKLRQGSKFDEVAREFSEDKARQGMFPSPSPFETIFFFSRKGSHVPT